MPYTPLDIHNLLTVVLAGRHNAKTARQIEIELNRNFAFPISGNQVKARGLITYAIQSGYLIKSSPANPRGYWLENNKAEINKLLKSLRRRSKKINQRVTNLKTTWNILNPTNRIR